MTTTSNLVILTAITIILSMKAIIRKLNVKIAELLVLSVSSIITINVNVELYQATS